MTDAARHDPMLLVERKKVILNFAAVLADVKVGQCNEETQQRYIANDPFQSLCAIVRKEDWQPIATAPKELNRYVDMWFRTVSDKGNYMEWRVTDVLWTKNGWQTDKSAMVIEVGADGVTPKDAIAWRDQPMPPPFGIGT
jgi:hypothetical protein